MEKRCLYKFPHYLLRGVVASVVVTVVLAVCPVAHLWRDPFYWDDLHFLLRTTSKHLPTGGFAGLFYSAMLGAFLGGFVFCVRYRSQIPWSQLRAETGRMQILGKPASIVALAAPILVVITWLAGRLMYELGPLFALILIAPLLVLIGVMSYCWRRPDFRSYFAGAVLGGIMGVPVGFMVGLWWFAHQPNANVKPLAAFVGALILGSPLGAAMGTMVGYGLVGLVVRRRRHGVVDVVIEVDKDRRSEAASPVCMKSAHAMSTECVIHSVGHVGCVMSHS